MTIRVALFRGINVGGHNKLPMSELVVLLESLGCSAVKTYIQSGNVVFDHVNTNNSDLSRAISSAIQKQSGFSPHILLLTASELQQAVTHNPFPDATAEPKTLHLWFLANAPDEPDLDKIEKRKSASESFVLMGHVFYLHAPDGIGRSKLAANVEKLLGVAATARNWRTVTRILDLCTPGESP